MKKVLLPTASDFKITWLPSVAADLIKKGLFSKMRSLKEGYIEVIDGETREKFGNPSSSLKVRINVRDQRFYPLVAFEGTIGAGESYILNYWTCDDLTALIRIFVINRQAMNNLESGLAKVSAPFIKYFHKVRQNTKMGSKKNIQAHYDLGDDFFSLFLDDTMTYSCGIFEKPNSTMKEASLAKNERICKKLDIKVSDHVVEIGSGWGGFAIHAAKTRGCRVTTTTISQNQFDFAKRRIEEEGLSDKITILLRDYREMEGTYDKLVSIEMIEAVGHAYYANFFETCARLLKPNGLMLLQAITISDQIYEDAVDSVDFIQRFIFPGSCIPSVFAISNITAQHTDLNVVHLEDITQHYPRTLRSWLNTLHQNESQILAAGYSKDIIRMWEFYLCYCEGGFLERSIGDVHMIFAKSGWRGEAPLANFEKAKA